MTQACARSWGGLGIGWTFCVLPRGHEGPCCGSHGQKPEAVLYFEEQPEATAFIQKQQEEERKAIAKKGAKSKLDPAA